MSKTPRELADAAKDAIDEAVSAKEAGNQPVAFVHVQNATVLANLAVMSTTPVPTDQGGYL